MSPHRSQPALSVAAVIRQAFAAPTDANAGVIAGLAAILSMFWSVPVVLLAALVVSFGMLDLWTGSRRARINSRLGKDGGFDRRVLDEGASGKAAAFVVILFLGLALDSVGALAGDTVSVEFAGVFAYTPAMVSLLAYRLAREISSVIENLESTPGGQGAIWPGAAKIVDAFRSRLMDSGSTDKRWGDSLSAEERAWIDEQLSLRRRENGA